LSQWDNAGELPNLRIVKEYDEEEIMSVILDNHKPNSIVIVDLDGRASTRATHAMLHSDLVLIPFGGSMLDAELAFKAKKMVSNVGAARGRELEYRGILTKAPASVNFYSRELISVLRILKALPFPMLQTHVAERQAYRALFSFGGSLDTLSPKEVPSLEQAKQNANRLGLEIIDILSGE
jgi:chromosome partitioning protein